jgi:hypothetical protein
MLIDVCFFLLGFTSTVVDCFQVDVFCHGLKGWCLAGYGKLVTLTTGMLQK